MESYKLVREICVEDGYDIIIAGGGPAGCAAAVCAGRLGARVLLLEATGCLGGMGTSGLVTAFDPMADGEKMLVGGFMRELVETMYERGYISPGTTPDNWRKNHLNWTPYRVEGLKLLLDELVTAAGVEVRFFTRVIDVDTEGKQVNGVVTTNIEGYLFIKAKAYIDCTGDAVLAHLSGVTCREAGKDTPNIMPATLTSLFAGIDWNRCDRSKHREILKQAIDEGHFTQPDMHFPGLSRVGDSLGYLNGGHVFNLNALRYKDLTDGMMLGRRIAKEYHEFLRKYLPGCENAEHVTTASLMGVRESRRIKGEYELTLKDYLSRRQFHDQVAVFNKYIDIHPYDCTEEEYKRFTNEVYTYGMLEKGECIGIPYGVLVPEGWSNLWVAGRCVSSDVSVHGSIRVQPSASMLGQAAGTAAVQAINTGQTACSVDTALLVETLRSNGAYLPQEELYSTMSRN